MKIIEHKFEPINGSEHITLVPLGDMHVGADACDWRAVKSALKYVEDTPNAYMIGMGDYLDGIIHTDKRYDPFMNNGKFVPLQKRQLIKALKPLASKGKIICMLEGNHETKLRVKYQYDIMSDFHFGLNVHTADYMSFVILKFKRKNSSTRKRVTVWAYHGSSGSTTVGGKLNALLKAGKGYDADIYLMAHVHGLSDNVLPILGVNNNGDLFAKDKAYCLTGNFLKTHVMNGTTYSEMKGFHPNKIGYCKIHIQPFQGVGHSNTKISVEKEFIN